MPSLAEQIRALPAAAPLLEALDGARSVHLVGGAVRDLLLDRPPARDLDLVVEGDAREVARVLADRLGGTATLHDDFLTARVTVGEHGFDLATARRERYPRPGALPEVEPATLEEDLLRRDFTVHALAASLAPQDFGTVRAVPGGLEDLEAGRLRVLHDRSFLDDPTRILRLVRYAARLGFAIDQPTVLLARQALGEGALDTVSGHRIGDELRLLVAEERALAALDLADGMDLLRAIDPALHVDRELLSKALDLLPDDGRREDLLLAGINLKRDSPSLGSGRDEDLQAAGINLKGDSPSLVLLRALLERLEAPSPARIVAIVRDAPVIAARLDAAARPSEIALAVGDASPEAVALAGALGAREPASRWLNDLRHVRADIDGNDLLAAGVEAGPAIGAGLRAAYLAKLDGAAPDRDAKLRTALQAATQR